MLSIHFVKITSFRPSGHSVPLTFMFSLYRVMGFADEGSQKDCSSIVPGESFSGVTESSGFIAAFVKNHKSVSVRSCHCNAGNRFSEDVKEKSIRLEFNEST